MNKLWISLTFLLLIEIQIYGQKEIEGRRKGFVPNGYVEMREEGEMQLKLFPEDFRMDKPKIGSKFPPFAFVDINGDSITSEMLEGKIALLNFTFVGCSGCKMEQFTLEKITKMYAERDDIVFINFINSADWRIKWYLNRFGEKGYISVPIDEETYKQYFHIVTAPTHMFLLNGTVKENISAPLLSENSYQFVVNFIETVNSKTQP
jgi:hypothetical protein